MKRKYDKLCFVIMPFREEMEQVYNDAIKPACDQADFDALRADELIGPYNIHRNIIQYIFSSDVVIADLTEWNPNVFYEMGVAHAIDNKTIMMIREGDDLPFDIVNYQCIKYNMTDRGLQKLGENLVKSLKAFEQWRNHPTNPVQDYKPHDAFVQAGETKALQKMLREKEKQLKESVPGAEHHKLKVDFQKTEKALQAKEQLLQNAKSEWQKLQEIRKKMADENADLKLKLQKLRLRAQKEHEPDRTKRTGDLSLRATPQEKLSVEEVKAMLQKHNFFCAKGLGWSNPNGKGILHKYEVQQNGQVVYDATTALSWQQSGSPNYMTYADAQKYIEKLNRDKFADYQDWRLPTLEEAMSLMEREKSSNGLYIDAKFDKTQIWIWTSDKYDAPRASRAWVASFDDGYCDPSRVDNDVYVRAVR